jgi:8-oxo-dGTP diphosphatase
MEDIKNEIVLNFGNKLRIRVCGICIEENKILLIRHHSIGKSNELWTPPGGGMNYGESAENALIREFIEETGLHVSVEKFLCVNEYLTPPLHAIELFFIVKKTGGSLQTGIDPELHADRQIITKIEWLSIEQLQEIPRESLHSLLHSIQSIEDFHRLSGFHH